MGTGEMEVALVEALVRSATATRGGGGAAASSPPRPPLSIAIQLDYHRGTRSAAGNTAAAGGGGGGATSASMLAGAKRRLAHAGDLAVATIPGAADAYPASTISVRLAEPIVPGAVTVPAAGVVLPVTWNAGGDSTAAVILSLRYANPSNSSYGNEQIYCTLKDDGRFEIPASALGPFLAAPNSTRSLRLTRWRTREALLDAKTILHIASAVDSTVRFP